MAGITSRPSRPAGVKGQPPTGSGSARRDPLINVRTLLTGPEPSWARPLLMVVVAASLVVGLVAALFALAPGVEPRAFEQIAADSSTSGLPASVVAQSFVSPRNDLSRLDLAGERVGPVTGDGRVRLLLGEGTEGTVIYDAPLSSLVATNGFALSFTFPPVPASEGVTYTVVLETPGTALSNAIALNYNSFDALSSGSMLIDSEAQPGDLAMSAYYRYGLPTLMADTVDALTRNGWLTLCWLLLLILPGLTLLVWLPNRLSVGQRILAAPCLSALALPVFYLLTRSLGIGMGSAALWAIMLICAAALAFAWLSARPRSGVQGVPASDSKGPAAVATSISRSLLRNVRVEDLAFWGLFATVLLATLASRLLSLRDAYAGAGLDAYHHTLISQMFIERGGIPTDYLPYAPLSSFTYHFGFHSLVATAGWLAGRTAPLDLMTLMPLAGQIAGALPVVALTLFGWKSLGNRWAGLAAGALVGVVSVFPAFYVNWSRYTQGLGLALLPVAWVLLLEALGRPVVAAGSTKPTGVVTWRSAGQRSGPYMLAVISAVGLALTHYRIVIIYAAFAALYLTWRLFASIRAHQPLAEALTPVWRGAIVAALSVLALLPWLANLRQNFTTNFVNRDASSISQYYDLNLTIGPELLNHWGLLLMIVLSLGGVGWAFRRRDPLPLLPLVVWLLLFLVSTPTAFADLLTTYWFWIAGATLMGGWAWTVARRQPVALLPGLAMLLIPLWPGAYPFNFRLPYAGYLDATTLVQGAWLPLALPAGYTLAELGRWIISLGSPYPATTRRIWRYVTAGAIGAIVLCGGLATGSKLGVMLDSKPYVAQADVEALTWMAGHVRPNSYVLANPFAFQWDKPPNQSVHGSDSGLWVPLVARGVQSSVPPLPAYNERPFRADYIEKLRDVVAFAPFRERPANWVGLKAAGITHIYVGSRGGAIYVPNLLKSPEVRQVFHKDAVWVFELK